MRFDRAAGTLSSFESNGTELLRTGPRPFFWRAPTDNDKGNGMPERTAPWKAASSNWQVDDVVATRLAEGAVEVRATGSLPDVESAYEIVYTVRGDGEVEIAGSLEPGGGELPELPRFGMQMTVPDAFDTVTGYGRGPHESYQDRKAGAAIGLYKSSVDDLYFDYSEPQETGNRTDVRWVTLTNQDGFGLQAIGIEPLSVSALLYTTEQIEDAKHRYEMTPQEFVTLNLDHKQTGVGGDDSWGARPHPQYLSLIHI